MAELKDTTISGNLAVTGAANISNGAQISGDDVTFLNTGTGDSPALIFQRGTLSDNYNDWKVVDTSGVLKFQQRGNGSTAWSDEVSFSTTGQVTATGFTGDGTNLTNVLHSVVAGTGLTGGTVSDGGTIALDTTRALTTADITTGTDTTNKLVSAKTLADALGGLGGGTVTSVGISNATNGGLSVSGSPVTTSGTITVGHSNVLTNAQTTQAVYPIKIDKNGHISDYGTAVTVPTINLNGSSSTSPSFYAPTTAGTNGYYLKSNGSGAPTWAAVTAGVSDVKINNTSIVSSGAANIVTNTAYNASTNKVATMTDINNAMTVVTFTPDGTNNNLIISVQQPSSIQNGNEVSY